MLFIPFVHALDFEVFVTSGFIHYIANNHYFIHYVQFGRFTKGKP